MRNVIFAIFQLAFDLCQNYRNFDLPNFFHFKMVFEYAEVECFVSCDAI